MNNREYALIVAGGKGTRLKSKIGKQFLELNGLPVVMHTILAFQRYAEEITIILVLAEHDIDTWRSLCLKHNFRIPVILQHGGDTRYQSVKNGLDRIEGDGLVAIHDGVRPLVNAGIISTSFRLAAIKQSAVAAVPLKDSIRITTGQDRTLAVDRSLYRLIQTPQTFRVSLIREAYQRKEDPDLTDDASIAERAGHAVTLFEGSYENIKITTAEDLVIAEALLKRRDETTVPQNGKS
ncbi:MAG: 2-C-methyl-D-erythritol 4-phosphate cytidylyltransferase [Cyclobacteriaceae bacterium]|nr:2-C-methyl-D-erythritol 4-phosphate cytidylyltransferase [Cyclobacteriaceae bacterium]MDH5250084.1 2-C-methyl-D-erythritol 4-phosphate cytidylyltransferase [Cyclobacteriaceae bacterium]